MEKEKLKKIIIENQQFISGLQIVDREISIEYAANYVFTGPRRAGKTYLMYQVAKDLVAKSILTPEQILFIGFEDERLMELKAKELDEILDAYFELNSLKPILFLDEIQNITGWEKFVRRLADKDYRVYVTGSNANLLSSEIASTLGGRFRMLEIQTLNFKEYLKFNGITLNANFEYGKQKSQIIRHFSDFLQYGGFPELIKFSNKREYLSSIFQKVFYGDILSRYKIKNDKSLRLLIKKIAESVNNETSYNRICNLIQSTGVKCGTATIIEYVGYLEASYLISSVENYKAKFVERESKKKYYFNDVGLLYLFLSDQITKLFENLTYNELYKKYGKNILYYKHNAEVDFYIPDEKILIQSCYNFSDIETREREIKAITKTLQYLDCKKAYIFTYDETEEILIENNVIRVMPLWKFALKN
jgi:hypothetical protein